MLYNKNNVRKTNDKKILHKVGKQWKVISVALLMAIGGGAAVATHANAQSNNGVNAATSAEAAALEEKPAGVSAVSSAPSSVAKSASASVKPASSVNYLQNNGGSAASYRAKAFNDNAQYKVNSAKVQSYVNSLNAVFPSATNSLNDAYNSAATKTNADKAAAQSYSNIAANKNYSSQVASLASKAGLPYSGFVQSVNASASAFANSVSNGSALNNQMSTVNSYAQLINNIQSNSALSQEYNTKFVSASANRRVAEAADAAALKVYNHFVNASEGYQAAMNNVKNASVSNSDAERIADLYSGLDETTTYSLASSLGYSNNSSATSERTHSLAAKNDFNLPNNDRMVVSYQQSNGVYVPVVIGNYNEASLNNASLAAANDYTLLSDTSIEDKYNSRVAEYNTELASYSTDVNSVSNAVVSASSALVNANNSLSSAKSEYDADYILGNGNGRGVSLSELFGVPSPRDVNDATFVSNYKRALNLYNIELANKSHTVSVATNKLFNEMGNSPINMTVQAAVSGIVSNVNAKQIAKSPEANKALDTLQAAVKGNTNAKNEVAGKLSKLTNTIKNNATLFHNANTPQLVAGDLAQAGHKTLANVVNNNPQAVQSLINAFHGDSNKAVNYINKFAGKLNAIKGVASTTGKNNYKPLSVLANYISENAKAYKNALNALANNSEMVPYSGILNPNSYASAKAAINGNYNASAINSLANSAASAYTSVESASNSYSAATEENVTLAGYYATSYSNDATSDEASESAAKTSLDDFYTNHADASYASASVAAASYASAEPNDNDLANAYGDNVYNYTPQFVTTEKSFGLYNVKDNKYTRLATVPANVRLHVSGVQIMDNGFVRYQTSYNGKKGTVTSYPSYVTPTYLVGADSADVVVNKNTPVYNNVHLMNSTKTKDVAKAGNEYDDVRVVSSFYGGVSRVQLGNNQFITGNTSVVSLANNENTQPSTNASENNSKVSFWK